MKGLKVQKENKSKDQGYKVGEGQIIIITTITVIITIIAVGSIIIQTPNILTNTDKAILFMIFVFIN